MAKAYRQEQMDLLGGPPRMHSSQELIERRCPTVNNVILPPRGAPPVKRKMGAVKGVPHAPARVAIRLQTVANAVALHGLDPSVEIPRILSAMVPVLDNDGNARLHPETGEEITRPAIDDDTKLRTYLALLEYLQPKLRSTDVKISGSLELTNEQLDLRLKALMAKTQPG